MAFTSSSSLHDPAVTLHFFFLSAVTLGLSWLSTSSSSLPTWAIMAFHFFFLSAVTLPSGLLLPLSDPWAIMAFLLLPLCRDPVGYHGFPLLLPLCRDPSGYHGFPFFFLSAVTLQGVGYHGFPLLLPLCRDPSGGRGLHFFFLSAVTLSVGYHGFPLLLSAVTLQGYHGFPLLLTLCREVGYHGFPLLLPLCRDPSGWAIMAFLLLPLCRDPSGGWAIMAFHFFFLSAVTPFRGGLSWLSTSSSSLPTWAIMAFHFFFSLVTPWAIPSTSSSSLPCCGLSWLSTSSSSLPVGYHGPFLCRDPSRWAIIAFTSSSLLPICSRDPSVTLQAIMAFLLLPLCRDPSGRGVYFFFLSAVTLPWAIMGRGLSWLSLLLPLCRDPFGLSWLSSSSLPWAIMAFHFFFLSAVTLQVGYGLYHGFFTSSSSLCRDPSGRRLSWLSTSSSSAVTLLAIMAFHFFFLSAVTLQLGYHGFPLLLPLCRDPSGDGYHGFHFFFLSAVTLQAIIAFHFFFLSAVTFMAILGFPFFFLSAVTLQDVGYHGFPLLLLPVGYHGFHFFFLSAVTLLGYHGFPLLLPLCRRGLSWLSFFFLSAVTLLWAIMAFHFFFLSVTLQAFLLHSLFLCRDPWAIMAFHFFFLSAVTLQFIGLGFHFFFLSAGPFGPLLLPLCRDPSGCWAIMAFHFFFLSAVGYHPCHGFLLLLCNPLLEVGYHGFPLLLPLCRWAIMAFHFFFLSAMTLHSGLSHWLSTSSFPLCRDPSGQAIMAFLLLLPLCRDPSGCGVGLSWLSLLLPLCRDPSGVGYHGFPSSSSSLPWAIMAFLLLPCLTLPLSFHFLLWAYHGFHFFFLSAVTLQDVGLGFISGFFHFFFLSAVTLQYVGYHGFPLLLPLCRDPSGSLGYHGFPSSSLSAVTPFKWKISWLPLLLPLCRDPSRTLGYPWLSLLLFLSAVTHGWAIMDFHFFFLSAIDTSRTLHRRVGYHGFPLLLPLCLGGLSLTLGEEAFHFFFLSAALQNDVGYHGFPFFFLSAVTLQDVGYHGFPFFLCSDPSAVHPLPLCRDPSGTVGYPWLSTSSSSLPWAWAIMAFHFFFLSAVTLQGAGLSLLLPLCRDPSGQVGHGFHFFFLSAVTLQKVVGLSIAFHFFFVTLCPQTHDSSVTLSIFPPLRYHGFPLLLPLCREAPFRLLAIMAFLLLPLCRDPSGRWAIMAFHFFFPFLLLPLCRDPSGRSWAIMAFPLLLPLSAYPWLSLLLPLCRDPSGCGPSSWLSLLLPLLCRDPSSIMAFTSSSSLPFHFFFLSAVMWAIAAFLLLPLCRDPSGLLGYHGFPLLLPLCRDPSGLGLSLLLLSAVTLQVAIMAFHFFFLSAVTFIGSGLTSSSSLMTLQVYWDHGFGLSWLSHFFFLSAVTLQDVGYHGFPLTSYSAVTLIIGLSFPLLLPLTPLGYHGFPFFFLSGPFSYWAILAFTSSSSAVTLQDGLSLDLSAVTLRWWAITWLSLLLPLCRDPSGWAIRLSRGLSLAFTSSFLPLCHDPFRTVGYHGFPFFFLSDPCGLQDFFFSHGPFGGQWASSFFLSAVTLQVIGLSWLSLLLPLCRDPSRVVGYHGFHFFFLSVVTLLSWLSLLLPLCRDPSGHDVASWLSLLLPLFRDPSGWAIMAFTSSSLCRDPSGRWAIMAFFFFFLSRDPSGAIMAFHFFFLSAVTLQVVGYHGFPFFFLFRTGGLLGFPSSCSLWAIMAFTSSSLHDPSVGYPWLSFFFLSAVIRVAFHFFFLSAVTLQEAIMAFHFFFLVTLQGFGLSWLSSSLCRDPSGRGLSWLSLLLPLCRDPSGLLLPLLWAIMAFHFFFLSAVTLQDVGYHGSFFFLCRDPSGWVGLSWLSLLLPLCRDPSGGLSTSSSSLTLQDFGWAIMAFHFFFLSAVGYHGFPLLLPLCRDPFRTWGLSWLSLLLPLCRDPSGVGYHGFQVGYLLLTLCRDPSGGLCGFPLLPLCRDPSGGLSAAAFPSSSSSSLTLQRTWAITWLSLLLHSVTLWPGYHAHFFPSARDPSGRPADFLSAGPFRGLSWLSLLLPLCCDPSGRGAISFPLLLTLSLGRVSTSSSSAMTHGRIGLSWLSTSSSSLPTWAIGFHFFFLSAVTLQRGTGYHGFPLLLPLCRDPYLAFFFFLSAVTLQAIMAFTSSSSLP
ncbi:unnamed protein product [Acanthosepion pharaonis]|uniref:Uncharacterized protein n=1 Tax=Acanthosepion pharaonis TaxID=158019 RepID=A0A812DFE4_ACAPH|nr:unnamed protein product [Sepia pharaonis]